MIRQLGVSSSSVCRHPVMRRILLEAYPEARLWDGDRITDEDVLIEFLTGCDAAIVGFEPITERVLAALPQLEIMGKFGAGCETLDFEALKRHGIRFGYSFGVNWLAVAELAVSFMVAGLRWVGPLNQAMRNRERPRNRDGRLLTGRTVGIHGCGNVGKEVVRLLQPYGCTIIACDVRDYPDFYRAHGVTPVCFDELLERAEVLTLHLPITRTTRGLYSGAVLQRLRTDCVLVNTCRGNIVDEDALCDRLEAGQLAAACFDVFAIEPATCDRLLDNPNMLAAPHIGAATEETRIAMVNAAIRGLTENELVDPAKFYEN